MKILKKNLKNREGEISLTPESLDDLWHLKHLVSPGDLVFSLTHRKIEGATDKLRPEKAEKKPVRLGVRIEKVEFHTFANRLRLHGTIEAGIDTGSYHTLNIEEGRNLSIIKKWRKDQLERIKEAESAAKRPKVIILTIEEGEAHIALVRQYGVEELAEIKQSLGKGEESQRGEFFAQTAQKLKWTIETTNLGEGKIIIAGPGFTKEDFQEHLRTNQPEIAKKTILIDTASTRYQEVLKRGSLDKILQESRLAQEAKHIETLLQEIATNGKAAYGLEEVAQKTEEGAVETLLITDETLHTQPERAEKLLKQAEYAGGKIVIFSTEFEPGKQLESLGGVAAILRYKTWQ